MYPDQIGKNWSWVEQNAINRGNYQNKNQSYSQHEKYDFGQERQKLKGYVEEQLHGDEAKRNYDILVKFQKEAEERKHRKIHRHRMNYNINDTMQNKSHFFTIEHSPDLSQHKKILGYGSGPRFSLLPAQKFKPPIYRYDGNNGLPMGHFRRNGTQDLNVYTKDSSNIYQLERPRGRTIDVEKIVKPNQYNWPLGKIKEIAAQKRKQKMINKLTKDQQLIVELQLRQEKTLQEYSSMARKIDKLKKYKKALRHLQHKRQE